MILNRLQPLLAQQSQSTMPFLVQIFPMIVMVGVFYLIFIRPQQRKAREHETLLKVIKKGDRILTTGGIVATVVAVKEKSLSIRSDETKFEILKYGIAEVNERAGDVTESKH